MDDEETLARVVSDAWSSLTDVERAALLLLAEDVYSPNDQIDVDKIAVLYDGIPIQSFASHQDPSVSEPFAAALLAIDGAARAIVSPYDMREKIAQLEECGSDGISRQIDRAREVVRRERAEEMLAPLCDEDDDGGEWLAFESTQIPAGSRGTLVAQPHDPFLVTHLAVIGEESIVSQCSVVLQVGRRIPVGLYRPVGADLYRVRATSDDRPIERGSRIGPSSARPSSLGDGPIGWTQGDLVFCYPSVPAVLTVENHSRATVTFRAALRGRPQR